MVGIRSSYRVSTRRRIGTAARLTLFNTLKQVMAPLVTHRDSEGVLTRIWILPHELTNCMQISLPSEDEEATQIRALLLVQEATRRSGSIKGGSARTGLHCSPPSLPLLPETAGMTRSELAVTPAK
jgi:hypothetical protein